MAAKTWEADFRYRAIQESIQVVRSERIEDIFRSKTSLCVPVGEKPAVGWTPGRIFLIFLGLGFLFLISAAVLGAQAERDDKKDDPVLIAVCAVLGLSGMGCFFVPATMDRFIMTRLLGSRGADLIEQPGELLCAEISHTDRSKMKIEIDGDDYVLCLADAKNRRLLIEGVAARYLIRAEDVTNLQPFEFMNYVGAEMTVLINGQVRLSLAIARVSLLLETTRQLPFLGFLRKRIKNPIYEACALALEPEEADLWAEPVE